MSENIPHEEHEEVNKMNITTEKIMPSGTELLVDGEHRGIVSQSPAHPDIPEEDWNTWKATIVPVDGGMVSLQPFESEEEAVAAGVEALSRKRTYQEWMEELENQP